MVSNPHRTDVGFGCENALHWHRLFILSRARLDCCTHLRQVELGPFGRGRACGEAVVLRAVHTWQVKPLWWRVWEVHCCETTPGLLHKLFILVTTSSQSKQPFPLVVLGLYTAEELFSASCVVHSKVSHSHSSNTNFYEVLKNNGIQVLPPTGKYQVAM